MNCVFSTVVVLLSPLLIDVSLSDELLCLSSRLLNLDDVQLDWSHATTNNFNCLIDPYSDKFFTSTVVPNSEDFVLNKKFYFTGLTTYGFEDGTTIKNYVSKFSIELIYSNDVTYNETFMVRTYEEVHFMSCTPIPAQEIRITALEFHNMALLPAGHEHFDPEYYWKLELYGCEDVEESMNQECSRMILPSTVTVTETVTTSCNMDHTTSNDHDDQSTTTSTVAMRASSEQEGAVSVETLVGTVIPLVLIILVIMSVFIIILVWIIKCRSEPIKDSSGGRRSRHKQSTLRVVHSQPLYHSSSNERINENQHTTSENMVINKLYEESDGQHENIVVNTLYGESDGPSADNVMVDDDNREYSSIDQFRLTNTNNYESVDQIEEDGIQANSNPAYIAGPTN